MSKSKNPTKTTDRELGIQTMQCCFHMVMSLTILLGCPSSFLSDTIHSQFSSEARTELMPHVVYLMSAIYNTVLYFKDPLTNHPFLIHHIIYLMLSPILLVYNRIGYLLCFTFVIYFMDLTDSLWQYRYANQLDHRRILAGMIKVHHCVTLLLIGISWITNFIVVGICVMFIHDVTDVPMFVLRILRKSSTSMDLRMWFTALVVIVTWIYFRVYLLLTIILEGTPMATHDNARMCLIGLMLLWTMNLYWTSLVVYKSIKEFVGIKTTNEDE